MKKFIYLIVCLLMPVVGVWGETVTALSNDDIIVDQTGDVLTFDIKTGGGLNSLYSRC